MHNHKEWFLEKHGLWFSLLCHLLLLLSFSVVWHPLLRVKPEPKPQMYLPSYLYQSAPVTVQQPKRQTQQEQKEQLTNQTQGLTVQHSVSKPVETSQASSAITPKQASKNLQGIHLVGDDKKAPKPLIKLLAKELSAHLVYPKIAVDFKVHGTAYVGFTIHPDGSLTDIRLVQSSNAAVLDQAAMDAVKAMTPGSDVAKYLPTSKFLVVGIIFG